MLVLRLDGLFIVVYVLVSLFIDGDFCSCKIWMAIWLNFCSFLILCSLLWKINFKETFFFYSISLFLLIYMKYFLHIPFANNPSFEISGGLLIMDLINPEEELLQQKLQSCIKLKTIRNIKFYNNSNLKRPKITI